MTIKMTVKQKVVVEAEIIFQHNILMLDVKYHICMAQKLSFDIVLAIFEL